MIFIPPGSCLVGAGAKPCRSRTLPNGRAPGPAIRLAVRDPSGPQGPGPGWSSKAPVSVRGPSCGWLRPRPPCRHQRRVSRNRAGVTCAVVAADGTGGPDLMRRTESRGSGTDHSGTLRRRHGHRGIPISRMASTASTQGVASQTGPAVLTKASKCRVERSGDLFMCPLGGAPGWTNDLEAGPAASDTARAGNVCGCGVPQVQPRLAEQAPGCGHLSGCPRR